MSSLDVLMRLRYQNVKKHRREKTQRAKNRIVLMDIVFGTGTSWQPEVNMSLPRGFKHLICVHRFMINQ